MAEPGRLMGQNASNEAEESDIDAEGELDDVEYYQVVGDTEPEGHTTDAEGSDVDAEGSDVDAEGEEVDDEDEGEPVGAVKIAGKEDLLSSEDEEDDNNDGEAVVDSSSDAKTSDSEDSDASSAESEVENEWQAESDGGEDHEAERSDPNECIFCGEDEDNDPSPEFEEYLACAVCGDNAHRQCARDANTLSPDDDAKRWRCPACIQNGLGEERQTSESVTRRRLSSVPKLARDLLPSHRGADPGGHSMFNDLILPDDPMDGSRSLRKRKASSHDDEAPVLRTTRKKRRSSEASKSDAEADASLAASSPGLNRTSHEVESQGGVHHSESEHESSRLRSARSRRPRPKRTDKRPLVWIEDSAGLSLVVVFHLNNEKVQKIVTSKPKKRERERERRRERDRERRRAQQNKAETPEVSHYPAIQTNYATPFYGFADKEMDESKNKPYGGILSEADADTSKTYPTQADRKRFEDARLKAEDDWKKKQAELYGAEERSKPYKQAGPPSKIKCINFGGWEIDTWHAAPYPEEYSKNKVLYICEFCLKYMNSDYVAWRHKLKCPAKHPPGDEIYRDGKYSFFEVDGRKNPVYCQNLCLLAKLFLGSKTLYYDVEPFLFYVMTENDNYGCHFVGYFSKEKRPSSLNNVSCILVLPIHMRKGYGQYLIEFSYLLTRVEKKTGSPEKPLSDMGLVSYRKYWRLVLCEELVNQKSPTSISAISERTGMTPDDIVSALEGLRALVRDPVTKSYALRLDYNYFRQYIEKCNSGNHPKINPDCLVWTPYVMGRMGQYEDGPALHTVQPREVEEEDKPVPEEGVQMEMAGKQNGTSNNGSIVAGEEAEPGTPVLPADESTNGGSPAPGTPLANGSTPALSISQPTRPFPTIPPTRYEIFPPIPGQPTAKRRPGRPFGSRRRTSTPQRNRNLPLSIATAPVSKMQLSPSKNGSGKASPLANGALTPTPGGSMSVRRTRSKLGETVVNGLGDETPEGGEIKTVNGRRSGTRSSNGSPNNARNAKSKGKFVVADDEDQDMDVEEDTDGEMDIDAEGEEDTVDVSMINA
ncbi:uncharacterized protein BDR25DRAFT_346061 [Lindgomyces ingoldianus]|uniref:Uncharacterized protein n=1 Tax=Lindgomyces ingoldianus TaxID=673940 RepID=A0ACB6QHD2_9PLEO|nr:uncharacterized protein BDR25DRAFT_346061 [Lindgomyces ingoldianus]KAF2465517.1 hypothetical protein BDR25DRAFT_346061 [Lindgomyces ingoldianus]